MAQSSLQAKGLESTIGISKDHIILWYRSDKDEDTAYEYASICVYGGETTCWLPERKESFYLLHGKKYWLFSSIFILMFYNYTQAKELVKTLLFILQSENGSHSVDSDSL